MRTTLTLDDDLMRKLKEISRQKRISFKEVVNETLRAGLKQGLEPVRPEKEFQVKATACGFVPGIDPGKLNQQVDELEAMDFDSNLEKGRS